MKLELEINLMNALDAEPRQSQRLLSDACNVSLGTIHYCINALIEKGFVKAKNFKNSGNKRDYAYILTPSGINHKRKITIKFLKRKKQEFDSLKREISLLEDHLKRCAKTRMKSTIKPVLTLPRDRRWRLPEAHLQGLLPHLSWWMLTSALNASLS